MDSNDAMEVDDIGPRGTTGGVVPRRPKMARSELSEIMEGISKGSAGSAGSAIEGEEIDMDADGEGESPGLDALATAASGMTQ